MDELDQLLQDLSAPKAITIDRPQPSARIHSAVIEDVPKAQKVDFNELDSLMAELGAGGPTPSPSKPVSMAISLAPSQASESGPSSSATASVDELLAELSAGTNTMPSRPQATASMPSKPAATPANMGGDDLDSVMKALQGLQTNKSTPAAAPFVPAQPTTSRKNELDNILNSLSSEMSEIGVASDFKGQCALCKKPVVGQAVTALGKTWHPDHFACLQCRKPLGSASFFEKDGMPYCEKCFHDMFSPKCAYCDGPIRERCINALGKTWHPDHFFCSQCGKNFAGGGFMEKEGKAYCEDDYFNMFAPKCGGCEKPIMADCTTALGRQWHASCFVCMECQAPFTGTFFEHDGKPYCEKHYHSQKGSLCASCQKPVVGRCITALGKKFHPEHFVCAFCMKQLAKGTFKDNSGKAYCLQCHVKLWG